MSRERKAVLLRLDPALHDALTRWANDELRSTNAHVEYLLSRALREAGRLPGYRDRRDQRGSPAAEPAAEPAADPAAGPDP